MRAILRSGCRWWCRGRFWSKHTELHPQHNAAWEAFKRLPDPKLARPQFLDHATKRHAETLGLHVVGYSPDRGVLLQVPSNDDHRIFQLIQGQSSDGRSFWSSTPEGLHAVCIISRLRLLVTAARTRNDVEDVHQVDIEAQNHKQWKAFCKGFTTRESLALHNWRGGAAKTQTRMQQNHCMQPMWSSYIRKLQPPMG
jgi:hypothetical protein